MVKLSYLLEDFVLPPIEEVYTEFGSQANGMSRPKERPGYGYPGQAS
jgi:hypothetical protein